MLEPIRPLCFGAAIQKGLGAGYLFRVFQAEALFPSERIVS